MMMTMVRALPLNLMYTSTDFELNEESLIPRLGFFFSPVSLPSSQDLQLVSLRVCSSVHVTSQNIMCHSTELVCQAWSLSLSLKVVDRFFLFFFLLWSAECNSPLARS